MKKLHWVFLKKIGTVCLLLFGIYCVGAIVVSAVSDHLKYTAPMFTYDSGYDDREHGEEIITSEHFAHNYAVFVFNRCYRPDARYGEYDLQWMARDPKNGVWKARFTDEGVLRAGSEVVVEFGYDGQLLAATGLFEPGEACEFIDSTETAALYEDLVYYHHCKNMYHMLSDASYQLNYIHDTDGYVWKVGYWASCDCVGFRDWFTFLSDGKIVEFHTSE